MPGFVIDNAGKAKEGTEPGTLFQHSSRRGLGVRIRGRSSAEIGWNASRQSRSARGTEDCQGIKEVSNMILCIGFVSFISLCLPMIFTHAEIPHCFISFSGESAPDQEQ